VIEGVGRVVQTPRISSGLGVIPRVVANGRAIYRGKLAAGRGRGPDRPDLAALSPELDGLMQAPMTGSARR
jgi:hypothetical protein